jgi:hypothetical protein
MDKSHFLDNFLNYEETDTPDIFEELQNMRNATNFRRFSFSVPTAESTAETLANPKSELDIVESEQSVSIQFPDDTYFYYYDDDSSLPPAPSNIQDSLTFPKELLFTTSELDNTIFKIPPYNSYDARKIWECARIPSIATIRLIETLLLDWAYTYASLEIVNNSIKRITWKSTSGCVCHSKWPTFVHWMICASVSNTA